MFPLGRFLVACAAVFLSLTFQSLAEEVIRSFDSLVQVNKDGSFLVTETLVVKAEGRKIRRGIFRDFPLYNLGSDGERQKVGFELISVKRDDQLENTRLEMKDDRVRIYIGRKEYFLPTGVYTYIITYKTDRQMRYFDTHDEVYWNATGNFWDFPIKKVLAQIALPEGAHATDWDVFTGRVGSKAKDATIGKIAGKRVIKYRTTRTLRPGEGMTVLAKVPKGFIDPPSDEQKRAWFWEDNKRVIFGSMVLAIVALYYFLVWWRIGRDPKEGVIVPRWKLPKELSPALVNYIHQKGLSGKGFDAISAAVLSLAVKGFVRLDKQNGGTFESDTLTITLVSPEPSKTDLSLGERVIINHAQGAGLGKFIVSEDHGLSVKALQKTFANALEGEHRDKFYKHNYGWIILGVILSFLGLACVVIFGNFSEGAIGLTFAGGIFTWVISVFALNFVKSIMSSKSLGGKISSILFAGFFVFTFLSTGFGAMFAELDLLSGDHIFLIIVVGIIVLNVVFYFLLGAPTSLGRERMDEIEGLKTYLTLAEKDRMNLTDVPDFSTVHYEKLLPYAVALGVEKPWSNAFDIWLASAVAAGAVAASYSPSWYSGSDFSSGTLSDTMGDFTNSMQSGFSDAMPVPKSSSSGFSGGGGSSGGGGGGGGGGGW